LTIAERISYLFKRLVNKSPNFVYFSEIKILPIITYFNSIFQFFHRFRILFIDNNKIYINTCLIYIFVDFHIRNEECGIIIKKMRISIFSRIKSVNIIAFFAIIITRPENKFQLLIISILYFLYCRCF
jgi:hypothetical protein